MFNFYLKTCFKKWNRSRDRWILRWNRKRGDLLVKRGGEIWAKGLNLFSWEFGTTILKLLLKCTSTGIRFFFVCNLDHLAGQSTIFGGVTRYYIDTKNMIATILEDVTRYYHIHTKKHNSHLRLVAVQDGGFIS